MSVHSAAASRGTKENKGNVASGAVSSRRTATSFAPTPVGTKAANRLLPLNLLRTLDCVVRHMSFLRAAEELCVSPSAVSQQISKLEDLLGVQLFRRVSNRLVMTDACIACMTPLRAGLEQIAKIPDAIETATLGNVLRVSVAPSFAAKWLVPRLERFCVQHPHIDVWINASMELVNFAQGSTDLAIRYGRGNYPGLHSELLSRETVIPVCSPALLEEIHPYTIADLAGFVLLHDDSVERDANCPDWPTWFRKVGALDIPWWRGLHFNQSHMVVDAAIAGRGLALAKGVLVADDLVAGRLSRVMDMEMAVECAYYLVCPPAHVDTPGIQSFRAWIHAEMDQTRRQMRAAVADEREPTQQIP